MDDRNGHIVCVDQTQEMHPAKLCPKRKKPATFLEISAWTAYASPLIKRCVITKPRTSPPKTPLKREIGIFRIGKVDDIFKHA